MRHLCVEEGAELKKLFEVMYPDVWTDVVYNTELYKMVSIKTYNTKRELLAATVALDGAPNFEYVRDSLSATFHWIYRTQDLMPREGPPVVQPQPTPQPSKTPPGVHAQ